MSAVKPEWVKKCGTIWKALKQHKSGWIFLNPVDAVKLNLHDYHTIIKHPMDLGTVKTQLDNGMIDSPELFKHNVELTFNNAMTYNPPGNDVHTMAASVLHTFKEKWQAQSEQIMALFNGAAAGPTSSLGKRPHDSSSEQAMTFEEKRQLTADLARLPGKKLAHVVTLIHEKYPKIVMQNGEDPDEIEIDLQSLDNNLLRYLETTAKEATNKKKKRN